MRVASKLTLFDRLAISLVAALLGLLTSAVVWAVVALGVGSATAHPAAFLFAPVVLGVTGFLSGEAFADVIGIWFHGILALVQGWSGDINSHPEPGAFKPVQATLFLVTVVVITVWLSLP